MISYKYTVFYARGCMSGRGEEIPTLTSTHTHTCTHTHTFISSTPSSCLSKLTASLLHSHKCKCTLTWAYVHRGPSERRQELYTCTHIAQGNEELFYSMCVNIIAAKALFLEISGTNSLCHITSRLNTLPNLLPCLLLNFTLRAMAQEKPPCTGGKRTPPQKTSLSRQG